MIIDAKLHFQQYSGYLWPLVLLAAATTIPPPGIK